MGFAENVLHKGGLYTKTEYEELRQNNQALWDALNSARACLFVYGYALNQELNCDHPEQWMDRMKFQVQRLKEEEEKVTAVLNKTYRR